MEFEIKTGSALCWRWKGQAERRVDRNTSNIALEWNHMKNRGEDILLDLKMNMFQRVKSEKPHMAGLQNDSKRKGLQWYWWRICVSGTRILHKHLIAPPRYAESNKREYAKRYLQRFRDYHLEPVQWKQSSHQIQWHRLILFTWWN